MEEGKDRKGFCWGVCNARAGWFYEFMWKVEGQQMRTAWVNVHVRVIAEGKFVEAAEQLRRALLRPVPSHHTFHLPASACFLRQIRTEFAHSYQAGPREDTKSAAGMLRRRVMRIEMWEVEEAKERKNFF